jgi:hypothetical protein
MGGFAYAGSLTNSAPVTRKMLTAETMFEGQLVKSSRAASAGGMVSIADIATEDNEDASQIIGICTGIVDGSRTYVAPTSGVANGWRTTWTSTMATVLDTGPSEVEVTLIIPGATLIRAPLCDATFGTALPVITNLTTEAAGKVVVGTTTPTTIADDFGTLYCRSGANQGLYRAIASVSTATITVTVPFPYVCTAGETFVMASAVEGLGGMDLTTAFDAVDGDNDMGEWYHVYYHEVNLEEAGKEYCVFSIWPGPSPEAS